MGKKLFVTGFVKSSNIIKLNRKISGIVRDLNQLPVTGFIKKSNINQISCKSVKIFPDLADID